MKIIELFLELFVIYILYKFIFDFVIPVYKTTKHVKQKVNDMQQQMRQNQQASANDQFTQAQSTPSKKPSHEDYIDYEEVK